MPGNIINLSPADVAKWPEPNYVDPERRTWMPAYAGVLYGVASIMIATRLWLRAKKYAGGLGLDDLFLICAWLSVTWFTSLSIVGSEKFMTSRHMWDVPFSVSYVRKYGVDYWIAELAFLITGCCLKVSVLLFYRRLVEHTCSKYWIWAVIFAICFTVAYSLAFILTLVFNCSPTEAYWKAFDPSYTHPNSCVNTTIVNLLAGIMAAVSDLYSVALPCIMTRHLQIPRLQKIALYIIFSLALLVVACSGVRTYYMYKVGHTSDVSTIIYYVFVWSQVELCLGLMCASLPSLRVLFREYLSEPLSKLKRSVTSSRSKSRRDSETEHGIVRRIDVHLHRSSLVDKRPSWSSMTSDPPASPAIDLENTTSPAPSPWLMKESHLVKSAADYEAYNLHNMEKYRQSAHTSNFSDLNRATEGDHGPRSSNQHSWLDFGDV
ncbi:hypothetical protein HII31_12546 [Pseudocercospora fuligena]|uniref:Rhodopsin domain-containing protein n=1 Tax=Pseudocercospora fuligena TaxID=685502 RepID=A0A8H6R7S6_9PEZI|nr:hypothetical protein HII31_12546 [Pseudocercospora fuligena]